jgi:hypothetical protein
MNAVEIASGILLCPDCDGVGTVEATICQHMGGNCPCSTREITCDNCEGDGRICRDCGESVPLSTPDDSVACLECVRAYQAEVASEY